MPPGIPTRLALAGLLLQTTLGAELRFEVVAEDMGIAFRHDASKTAEKYLVEAMGAGVATLDFDGDGLLDVYFVNGADLARLKHGAPDAKTDQRYWNRLYRNTGDWNFEDVTERAGVAGQGYGMGVAVADYDADGDPDLFVSNFGPDALFRNEGDGSFREVSDDAGIERPDWSSGAAFLDFNGDGWARPVHIKLLGVELREKQAVRRVPPGAEVVLPPACLRTGTTRPLSQSGRRTL